MYVTYNGPTPVRRIPLPDGRAIKVKRGESVEVPDAVGKRLIRQKYFEESQRPAVARQRVAATSTATESTATDASPTGSETTAT